MRSTASPSCTRSCSSSDVLKDFYELWPEKFSNKTNGVTPRRWMVLANPRLAALISDAIGDGWIKDLAQLAASSSRSPRTPTSARAGAQIKRANKRELAAHRRASAPASSVDPDSLFDVQVKRIHEYKRQHLNILHVIALYHRLKSDPRSTSQPRTFIFGGKAAPGYHLAKLIIKLITAVGEVVNRDPQVRDRIKVVFLPNFNVTNGQRIYPAADLSEQISHRRQGSLRHRQHEVLHERRAHHRHAGRRQHRDPRGGRRRRTSSCSG